MAEEQDAPGADIPCSEVEMESECEIR